MSTVAQPLMRPLGVGQLLDRAIRLYRRHFLIFLGIVALIQVPVTLVETLAALIMYGSSTGRTAMGELSSFPGAAVDAAAVLSILASLLGYILIEGIAVATIIRVAAQGYLGLPAVGIRDAYRLTKDRWLPLIGAILFTTVIGFGLMLWTVIPCVGWLTGFGMLYYLGNVITRLLAPVVVLEKQAPTVAWRRAWELTRRRFWWVLGFTLVLGLFIGLVFFGPATLLGVGGMTMAGAPNPEGTGLLGTLIGPLVNFVIRLLSVPLMALSMMLLYFDLRVRTEGLDLTLGASGGEAANSLDVLATSAPKDISGKLLTQEDWRNFLLFTVVFVVVPLACLFFVSTAATAIFG